MVSDPFPAEVFRERRRRVFTRLADGAMVLPGASVQYRSRDTEWPFRPDSELFYLTGLREPDVVVVLRGHADDERFVVFVRERDAEAELWHGARPGVEATRELTGADVAYPLEDLRDRLPSLLEGAAGVHARLGGDERVQQGVLDALARARARGAKKGVGPRSVTDPGGILDEMRLRKDDHEIALLRRAAEITVASFRAALAAVEPGVGEWEIEAAMDAGFRSRGADGSGFPTIVASGANACTLHYAANDRRVAAGDLVLIDAGASVSLYQADVTRTVPASGRFEGAQRDVVRLVADAKAAAIETARVGSTMREVHLAAVTVLTRGLVDLGVLHGEADGLAADEAYKPYFPHGTSHWLGLDVHDVGDSVVAGEPRVLEPGMVLTVEPGLYFPRGAAGVPAALAGIGVRLEDDVLVARAGPEVLTGDLPSDVDGLERR